MTGAPLADDTTDGGRLTICCMICGRPHQADQMIQASVDKPDGMDWQLSVSVSEAGEAKIHEAYCPEHRLTNAIEDACASTLRLERAVKRQMSAVGELESNN